MAEKILDHTPFLLTRCSRDLRYLYVSNAYATMIGRKPEDLVERPIIDIMGAKGFETIRPHVEAVLRGERVEYEAEIVFEGAGPRQLHVIYVPDRDEQDQVVGWIASLYDVSERKKAVEEQAHLKRLAAEMDIGIWDWDIRKEKLNWTRELEVIFGLNSGDAENCPDFHKLVHPDDVSEVEAQLAAAIKNRETFQQDFRIVRPDGQIRWVMSRAHAVYDSVTGEATRIIGHDIDITEKKVSEAQAERHRNKLVHLVRVATLEGLSGGIARELAQPLISIIANAQAAQALLVTRKPDLKEVASILEEIVQSTSRADTVIRRLRKLVKKEDHRDEVVQLNDLIASTLQLLHSELVDRKIKIDTHLESVLPTISGDP